MSTKYPDAEHRGWTDETERHLRLITRLNNLADPDQHQLPQESEGRTHSWTITIDEDWATLESLHWQTRLPVPLQRQLRSTINHEQVILVGRKTERIHLVSGRNQSFELLIQEIECLLPASPKRTGTQFFH